MPTLLSTELDEQQSINMLSAIKKI